MEKALRISTITTLCNVLKEKHLSLAQAWLNSKSGMQYVCFEDLPKNYGRIPLVF